jgi:hypothetical protein
MLNSQIEPTSEAPRLVFANMRFSTVSPTFAKPHSTRSSSTTQSVSNTFFYSALRSLLDGFQKKFLHEKYEGTASVSGLIWTALGTISLTISISIGGTVYLRITVNKLKQSLSENSKASERNASLLAKVVAHIWVLPQEDRVYIKNEIKETV